jgi:hypothetical protein
LYAIAADPAAGRLARTARAVRFGMSLAVRRPARTPVTEALAAPGLATGGRRPALELFVAALGLVILGTVGTMLLVLVPGFILAAAGDPDAEPGNVAGWPFLAMGPILIILGTVLGRRMARRPPATGPVGLARAMLAVAAAVTAAQAFLMFGEGLAPFVAIAVWAACLAPMVLTVTRRRRGPLPWLAVAVGAMVVIDVAVTAAIWLAIGPAEAPRTSVLAWYPTAMLDPVVRLPLGPPGAEDSTRFAIVDFVEFLPHALLVATAFGLSYARIAAIQSRGTDADRTGSVDAGA